jgi:hypothetical protein
MGKRVHIVGRFYKMAGVTGISLKSDDFGVAFVSRYNDGEALVFIFFNDAVYGFDFRARAVHDGVSDVFIGPLDFGRNAMRPDQNGRLRRHRTRLVEGRYSALTEHFDGLIVMDERSDGINASWRPRRVFERAIDRALDAHAKSRRVS